MAVPPLEAKGRFEFYLPFVAKPNVIYHVTALREFRDIALTGADIYAYYYVSAGITEGKEINGKAFSFTEEVSKEPVIVTLEGSDGSILYVPSTFIKSFPLQGGQVYSRLILSVDLGSVPDTVQIDVVQENLKEAIEAGFGVKPKINVHRVAALKQPTPEEHDLLEAARLGSIKTAQNSLTQVIELKRENEDLRNKINAMIDIMRKYDLLS